MKKEDLTLGLRLGALADFKKDGQAKNYHLRVTSGTAGGSPLLIAKHRRLEVLRDKERIMSDLGAVVLCWGQVNTRVSLLGHFLFFYEQAGRRAMSLSEADLTSPDFDEIMEEFSPDSFCGLPSFTAQALLKIRKQEVLNRIKHLRLAGERISETQYRIFKEKAPGAKIISYYASVEAGYMSAFPCRFLKINTYHPAENVILELDQPDESGIGQIVISVNLSQSVRLEKYATGDMGRFLAEKCPCGQLATFEVLGRKNFDFIKFLGATLRQEVFEQVIGKFNQVKDYRILTKEVLAGDKIVGQIIVQAVLSDLPDDQREIFKEKFVKTLVEEVYLTPTRTFKQLVGLGVFLPPEIEIVKNLPPRVKAIKMKKIS